MKKSISFAMVVLGVGVFVFGCSAYVPAGAGDFVGWSESCRYTMVIGAMMAVGGLKLP
jgi:hypothetical protein